ncbi:MAG: BPSS1780 family membrane protein [Rhodoferax sp.]|mgnify:FL=1
MKLHEVPPSQGLQWVLLGLRTFFRQPMALMGQFFMFVATVSVLSLVPIVGPMVGMILVPAATVGLMAATREAHQGRFPMPTLLVSAFRAGPAVTRSILTLGALYLVSFALVISATYLADGGTFMRIYLGQQPLSDDALLHGGLAAGAALFLVLYIPLTLVFWHAPALVVWHGMAPAKSLFFSAVASWRNLGAMAVFSLIWTTLSVTVFMVAAMIGGALGGASGVMGLLYPLGIVLAAMFFASIYFTFADSFEPD